MTRRGYDDYERELRDRRARDMREMQRDQDRLDGREHRRIDNRDPDRMDYLRDGRPELRTTRDPALRPMYAFTDQNDRDDLSPRGYMDEPRDRHRPPIDLQPERRQEPSSRYQDYFLLGEGINREVIQFDICRYLGNDATVRPYDHPDGRRGFLIKAYRAPTTAMIATLKQDSKRYENEAAQRRRQFGQPGVSYASSATLDDRERIGRPDVAQIGYAGYGQDIPMDDYDDDRAPGRGYRDQESRMEPRIDQRQDPRPDQRQPLPIGRPGPMPTVHPGFVQEPAYPFYQLQPTSSGTFDPASQQPRTLGPSNTPPPPMGRGGPQPYSGGFPVVTSAGYSTTTSAPAGAPSRYADAANPRMMGDYSGGIPYTQDRHAARR